MKDAKVKLYGIDYNLILPSNQSLAMDIFDFVTNLNHKSKIPKIDHFSLLLFNENHNLAIDFLDTNQDEMRKLLTTKEIEYILHILRVSKEIGSD